MASPSATSPSNGTTSPILATTMSPFLISLAGTIISVPSFFSHTLLILSDILRAKSPTDFLCVHSSKSSPTPNRNIIEPAVLISPLIMETLMAVASKTGTSNFPFANVLIPIRTYLKAL